MAVQTEQTAQSKRNSPFITQQPNLFYAEREIPLSGHRCTSGLRGKANISMKVMGSPLGQSSRKSFLLTWPVTRTAKHAEAEITSARGRRKERRQRGNRNALLSFSLSLLAPAMKPAAGAGYGKAGDLQVFK